jgi:hypothetical protein
MDTAARLAARSVMASDPGRVAFVDAGLHGTHRRAEHKGHRAGR